MYTSYENKIKQFDVRYQIVCRMNNQFDQKIKKYEQKKESHANPDLANMIRKLQEVYTQLGGSQKSQNPESIRELSRVNGEINSFETDHSSYNILHDVLHSFSLANVGSGYFGFEKDQVEKFNLVNEFTQTLHGTQMKTAKSILARIRRNIQSKNQEVQTEDDRLSELSKFFIHI